MRETYKVLGAMIALRQFTAKELAERTDVKPATVNTVITRKQDLLEYLGTQKTDSRGGQPKRYKVKPDKISTLQSEFEELYKPFAGSQGTEILGVEKFSGLVKSDKQDKAAQQGELVDIPLGLLSANDILVRRYPKAKTIEKKEHLLKLAELDYQGAMLELDEILSDGSARNIEAVNLFKGKVDILHDLYKTEVSLNKAVAAAKEEPRKTAAKAALNVSRESLVETEGYLQLAVSNLLATVQGWAAPMSQFSLETPSHFQIIREPDEVFLIDGIDGPDELTDYLRGLFQERHILATIDPSPNVFESVVHRNNPPKCVLTVDSGSSIQSANNAWQHFLSSCPAREQMYVFDNGSNEILRNQILQSHANYQNNALQLQPEAILATLRFGS